MKKTILVCCAALSANLNAEPQIPAPQGLEVFVTGSDVYLTWSPYDTSGFPTQCTDNQEIQIYRAEPGDEIAATDITATHFMDEGVAAGTYVYKIRARCKIPGPPARNLFSDHTPFLVADVTVDACSSAPELMASVTPSLLWPPNGKMVPVTVIGQVIPGYGCPLPSAITYSLIDEYGELSGEGVAEVSGGEFLFQVNLEASRLGSDFDGRRYAIEVHADQAGLRAELEAALEVVVPHDQRKR